MVRRHGSPPVARMLYREPLRTDKLDRQVIRGMSGFERKLVDVLESDAYARAVEAWERRRQAQGAGTPMRPSRLMTARFPLARALAEWAIRREHIDYCLFGVLPAAVERDVLMAVGPTEEDQPGRVTAQNLDSKYTRQTFAPAKAPGKNWALDIDKRTGYYGVLDKFFKANDELPRDLDLLVTGSVPAGSGLSSSAAMVVASTLSFLAVNDKLDGITKGDLVEMAVENETRVGMSSMDQSASVICNANSALFISFFPRLSAKPIPLPITSPCTVIVCANSLVVSDKVVHSRTRYNLRVVETLAAARVLAQQLGVPIGKTERLQLRVLLDRWLSVTKGVETDPKGLKEGLEKIVEKLDVLKLVDSDGSDGTEIELTLEEMIALSGLSTEEFTETYLSWVDIEATRFQLYKRAKHVFLEALRVLELREVCLRGVHEPSDDTLRELGRLLDESQKSCMAVYECSCPEVDQLTRLAKQAGAYGSRQTGAGLGGCTVSLVEESRVSEFIEKMRTTYPPYHGLKGEELSEATFPTKPSSGATGV
ncbi:galactokinase gal [Phellopilus nigrolimitatus]|nr:galactokinase gal [Phellopilus nigrolimitatus]